MTSWQSEDNRISRDPKVLITGGAGFIGSHLTEALLARGSCVTVIDDLSTGRFENIEPLTKNPEFHFVIDSITNQVVMDRLVSECDLIIHLAAAVGVMLIVEHPVHTIETNVMGTEVVLKTALRYRKKVLIASTSEVYGKGNQIPFREEDDVVLGPTSRSRWAYAASKMVDEFLGLAYFREKDLPVVIFRLFNTVGPRQQGAYGMVIPRFIESALQGDRLQVFGTGEQTRCFLHVGDAVDAILRLTDTPQAVGGVYNIGATQEISIFNLACKVLQLIGEEGDPRDRIDLIPYDQAYAEGFEDMQRRVPDISAIQSLTGWTPKVSLDEILKAVIADQYSARSNTSTT